MKCSQILVDVEIWKLILNPEILLVRNQKCRDRPLLSMCYLFKHIEPLRIYWIYTNVLKIHIEGGQAFPTLSYLHIPGQQ